MWNVIVALTLLVTSTDAPEVSVKKLDGTSLTGVLEDWADGTCVFETADGRQSISQDQLLSIQWSPAPRSAGTSQPTVELVDGSVLPITAYRTSSSTAHFTLHHSGPPQERTADVPLDRVRAVWLQPIGEELVGQWEEIRALERPSDLLVLVRQHGQSLDYVEGVAGEITDDEVQFTLDDKTLSVPRAKVAGVIYYRATSEREPTPSCVLVGRDGLRANASKAHLADGRLRFVTVSNDSMTWPLGDLYVADFSAGKVLFLSDLEPASAQWTPWVGLPDSLDVASAYGRVRRDESAYGRPLTLWHPGDEEFDASGHEEVCEKGLAIRSRTELVYRLPRGFRRFLAVAGIEPATSHSGDVQVTIEGDGRPLWEGRIAGDQPPVPIDLDIDGAKRLTILVDYGEGLDTGDWLNLCNARIVK